MSEENNLFRNALYLLALIVIVVIVWIIWPKKSSERYDIPDPDLRLIHAQQNQYNPKNSILMYIPDPDLDPDLRLIHAQQNQYNPKNSMLMYPNTPKKSRERCNTPDHGYNYDPQNPIPM